MTHDIHKLPADFNAYMLGLNLPAIAQMQQAGFQVMLARGSVGAFARRAVVMICLDHEAEVIENSALDLIRIVRSKGDEARAPLPPN